jgi:two-component system, LuxR family, sensor histidine kinase DctS
MSAVSAIIRRWRRPLLWSALVCLLAVAQALLVALTVSHESTRAQDMTEAVASEVASDIRRQLTRAMQELQGMVWADGLQSDWGSRARALMPQLSFVARIERRGIRLELLEAQENPAQGTLYGVMRRADFTADIQAACMSALRSASPSLSRSYFIPGVGGAGAEVMDLCIPLKEQGREAGFLVATLVLAAWLDSATDGVYGRRHELSFVESDGARLARTGAQRGAGVYVAERAVDLPGQSLLLRVDSTVGRPSLIPNLTLALVLGLSLALTVVVVMLARDVRRRAHVERALAEALTFRKAMEDSLPTGLRARDLQGQITYVNPAFCAMVGFSADEMLGRPIPPYWPPEQVGAYQERHASRLAALDAGGLRPTSEAREGYETLFMRREGERFPVVIYEAPLVDAMGRQTGWMSAVLDLSAQRRAEEFSRQQQERLQAAARLATVGEMASLLSHELNQPLAAIASYASGSLNLLDAPAADTPVLLREAMERVADQAERAGRIIKSVHGFVRRREQLHETVGADQLLQAVLPLIRLQARKNAARIEVSCPTPAPQVRCDRTMVEQVLLNLARNGLQAMEIQTPQARRVLVLQVRQTHERWVAFSVQDEGTGIAPEVAARLFTPFFSTRTEGMGLGLSLCRTVIEQHGGALDFEAVHDGPQALPGAADGQDVAGVWLRGARFRFTLPAASPAVSRLDTPSS